MTYRFRAGSQRRWSRSWSRVMRSEERFDLENTPFRFRKPLRPIRLQKKKCLRHCCRRRHTCVIQGQLTTFLF